MTVETSIERALFERMTALVLSPALQVSWPNLDFDPPDGETYLRVDHLRNNNTRHFVRGSAPHLRQGILQVTVVAPLNRNPQEATAIAGNIAAHFPADLDLYEDGVRVRIQLAPDVATPEKTDVSWDVVLSVRYESFI